MPLWTLVVISVLITLIALMKFLQQLWWKRKYYWKEVPLLLHHLSREYLSEGGERPKILVLYHYLILEKTGSVWIKESMCFPINNYNSLKLLSFYTKDLVVPWALDVQKNDCSAEMSHSIKTHCSFFCFNANRVCQMRCISTSLCNGVNCKHCLFFWPFVSVSTYSPVNVGSDK